MTKKFSLFCCQQPPKVVEEQTGEILQAKERLQLKEVPLSREKPYPDVFFGAEGPIVEASPQSIGTSSMLNTESIEGSSCVNSPPLKLNIDLYKDVRPPLSYTELVGSGGFADVYKSYYYGFPAAIKVFHLIHQNPLSNDQQDAFKHELLILRQLDHKNIIKFYGASSEPGNRALVMEYLEYDLFQIMINQRRSKTRFSLFDIFRIIKAIAGGLEYLHSRKIVHRDLHPGNVLISKDFDVKVADVGISKIMEHATSVNSKRSGMVGYIAPELQQYNIINFKSDIFSLAIIAWELWTLDDTWNKHGQGLLCQKISQGERPDIPRDMPQNLRELITNCWQQDYKKRPSAFDVKQECEIELAQLPNQNEMKN